MNYAKEEQLRITNELDLKNKEGILYWIIEDLKKFLQKVKNTPPEDRFDQEPMAYDLTEEHLDLFKKDLRHFDVDQPFKADVSLFDHQGYKYFDFYRDVISIPDLIRESVIIKDKKITFNMKQLYLKLDGAVDEFRGKCLMPIGGHYFYAKDACGKETCYYVFKDLITDKWEYLNKLAEDTEAIFGPVEIIDTKRWIQLTKDNSPAVSALTIFIQNVPYSFPFVLITHYPGDNTQKFTAVRTFRNVDWDSLISEYAAPHAFKIGPEYIPAKDITVEQANERGMYALADEIQKMESLFLKKERKD